MTAPGSRRGSSTGPIAANVATDVAQRIARLATVMASGRGHLHFTTEQGAHRAVHRHAIDVGRVDGDGTVGKARRIRGHLPDDGPCPTDEPALDPEARLVSTLVTPVEVNKRSAVVALL